MIAIDRAALALIDVKDGDFMMPEALKNFVCEEPACHQPQSQVTIYGPLWQLGWTTEQVWRVIVEYKRFLTLVMKNEQPVVPPAPVDLLWRIHHNYPQSYASFCRSILDKVTADYDGDVEKMESALQSVARRLFEHDLGTSCDGEKYAAQHRSTIGFYLEVFGEPPLDIWSEPAAIAERPGW